MAAAVLLGAPAESAAEADTGTVSGKVDVRKGRGKRAVRKGVVVYLKDAPAGKKPHARAEIRQKDQKFRPKVTVVVVGTTVDFPNDDLVAHNVFSRTRGFRDLDLGEYKGGNSEAYTFRRTGEVDLHCNIHPEMAATVKVVPNEYYAITDSDGSFEITDVPPGTYTIVTWLPYAVEKTDEVKVEAGMTASVLLEIQVGSAPSSHLRKDGTTYGRGYH